MPAILKSKYQIDAWLDSSLSYSDCMQRNVIVPCTGLQWYRVNPCVGNINNKSVNCLQSYEDYINQQYAHKLDHFITNKNISASADMSRDNSPLKHRLIQFLPDSIQTTPIKKQKSSHQNTPISSYKKAANKSDRKQRSLDSMLAKRD